MEFKFGKEPTHEDSQPQSADKGRQTGLLILLLVLVGGFGYVYFFTGMIRPQEQPPPPPPPPQVVKQPLPARDAAPPVATASPKPSAAPATPAAPPAVSPGKPQQPAAVGPAAAPATKPQEAKPAAAKPAPTQQKAVEPAKPATQPVKAEQHKPVVAKVETKPAAAKPAQKPAAMQPAKQAPVEHKAVAKSTGPWTVVVGYYVVEETLAADMARVKKAGLSPVMTSGPKRPVAMHRLYVGEYGSRAEGLQVLAKVKQIGGSGFLVQRGELYDLFAGSYAVANSAEAEQQRLAAANIKASIRKVQVPLATRKLTAGTFTDRKAAEAAIKKLKGAAIGTPVLE